MNTPFSSDDYNPTRKYKHTYENISVWPDCQEWMIGDINISQGLKQFRETSSQLTDIQGDIKAGFRSTFPSQPDWFAYVKQWTKKFTIAECEVKPPSKVERGDISAFVKLGIEMREMLDDATVFGILIEGKLLTTYAMNIKCGIYRMIQLGEFNVISTQSELDLFDALFTGLMQVKNIASDTARVIEETEREHSCGKKREHASERSSARSTPTLKKLRPDTSPQC